MKNFNIFQRILRKLKSKILIQKQEANPFIIPIFIINFNRLTDLKILIDKLQQRGYKNIYIIDNNSTYPPLLEYYENISKTIKILNQKDNIGHLVFWKKPEIFYKHSLGYYVITDSDIIPNDNLPKNFMKTLVNTLKKYPSYTKAGFSLRINDIPDGYPNKNKVIEWEKQFWNLNDENENLGMIDTTFALYRPKYLIDKNFYSGIRLAGNFIARHGGWYLHPNNLTEEDIYYYNTATEASSGKIKPAFY